MMLFFIKSTKSFKCLIRGNSLVNIGIHLMDAYVIIKKAITKIIMEKYYHVMLKGRKQNITCPLRLKHFKNEACLLNTTEG